MKDNYAFRSSTFMRALLVLLFMAVSIQWGFAQLNLNVSRGTLGTVIEQIKSQSKYQFFYDDKLAALPVENVKVNNASIEDALNVILKGKDISYKVEDNIVYLSEKSAAPQEGNQQGKERTITGVVSDDMGPLIGVNVLIKGTSNGCITDLDGNFTLTTTETNPVIVFSYIGYTTQEIPVKGNAPINVMMAGDTQQLEEVVVTALGIKRSEKALSYNVQQVNTDAITSNKDANFVNSLSGKVAGVNINASSSGVGGVSKVVMRGTKSIMQSSNALYVIDGVPIFSGRGTAGGKEFDSQGSSEPIADINPEDIESMSVLTGAAAAALYGSEAANGAIVITTKKGKAGVSKINYTGEFTTRMVPSYKEFNIMNSQEQMGIYKELEQKGWLNSADLFRAKNSGVYGRMYKLIDQFNETNGQFGLMNTLEARNAYLTEAEMRNTDWFDVLFSNNISQNHSVSITSGSDKSSFYASLSAMLDPGWYKQSEVKRYTANLNTTYNILKNLSINLISSASYRKQKAPGTLGQDIDLVNGQVKREFDINPYSYALNTSRTLDPNTDYVANYAPFNILRELDNNFIELNVVDVKFQGELKWKPITGLEFSALGAVKYSATSQEHLITDDSNQAMAYRAMPDATVRDRNPFLYTDPDNPYALPISILPEGGIYQRQDRKMLGLDFRGTVSWNHLFAEKHITNLFAGMEVNDLQRSNSSFQGWGMQYSMGEIPSYVYQYFKKGIETGEKYYSMGHTRYRSVATFANATYSYDGRYTLNGTFRYEGTNRMGRSRSARWLPTWNLSAAWNVHEEKFFQSLQPTLSNLTFKASYSLTADRGPADVTNSQAIIKSYSPYRPFTDIQETGLHIVDLENSELTYEKKHELNIGVDVGFINNRINLSADWYTRNNYDLIGLIPTQGVGGTIYKYANVATMKSHGIEFTLSTSNIKTKDFSWNSDFIFSHAKNEVTDLRGRTRMMELVSGNGFAREGYPVRGLFSIPFAGLDEKGIPMFDINGNITSTDINFQEREKLDYLKYEGPTDPTITGSFGNVFAYKGFKLNVFMTYSFGNVVRLNPYFNYKYSDLSAMPREFKNRWTLSGDEAKTNIPAILSNPQYEANRTLYKAYNAYNYSTERIAKGDFIRMKEISLSYEFPKSWISAAKISNLSLKLQATNLFLIYADKKLNGQDPEFFNTGGVASPVPRQFTLTLRLGL